MLITYYTQIWYKFHIKGGCGKDWREEIPNNKPMYRNKWSTWSNKKANKMVWSPDKVRREHARTKSFKSSIDAVQKTARETQAYLDWNDEETITNNKFDMGRGK